MKFNKSHNTIFILIVSATITLGQMGNFHSPSEDNCKFCHYPTESESALRIIPANNNSYIPYNSMTMDAEVSQPLGSSKLCLSCHDGTFALNDVSRVGLSKTQNMSTNLSHSHPVSFEYGSYLANKDGELHDPLSSPSGMGGTIYSDMLINGNLECISCHNVHNQENLSGLLIKSNAGSQLCLTCHDK